MDRGEFQQDSVLKQLEVLKEEEKEFQNLKVRWSLEPASVPKPTKRWGQSPPGHSWQRGCTRGCWESLSVPTTGQNQLMPQPALLLPGCLSPGHVPRGGGLSQRAVPVQGQRLWSAGTVFRPQQLLGDDTKVWCQHSGVQGALVSRPGGG